MCKLFIFTLVFLLTFSATAKASLKDFETDGCTYFVDGTPKNPSQWKECCTIHDMRYWFGGSLADQDVADLRLKSCVEKKSSAITAEAMYRAVRLGHYSPIKNKHAWSWGWITPRKRIPLNLEESELAISSLRKLPYDKDFIENFISINFPKSK